ncbi:MAG: anti-CBASS Acb1 family protein [Succiniclasticum sp.]|nr:anti-CBASS Acb1 family protein [Succiniclasticum sp.]MEE3479994.1 anti-CBASS Acb1 family protein [Succiniclasticum sp.]
MRAEYDKYRTVLHCIAQCLEHLPPTEKEVVTYRGIQGESWGSIADRTNMSESSCRSYFRRGVRRMTGMYFGPKAYPEQGSLFLPGDYKGLLVLDRWNGITPESSLIQDPTDGDFGLPEFYDVTCDMYPKGIKVHHSRIIRFIGQPLPYYEQLAENYWGASELEHVIDELKKRDNVSWNIAMLTFMANLRVMKMEGMSQILATGGEQAQADLYRTIMGLNAMMNNNSLQILGENDSFETHQYTFGGIADTYDRFMMDVAGAAETPVTKLFGRR